MYRVTGLQIKPSVKTHPIHTYAHTTHTHTHTNGKIIGMHDIIHPHPMNPASKLVVLITRKDIDTSRHAPQATRLKTHFHGCSPPHYHHPTKIDPSHVKKSSPLDHDPKLLQYLSEHISDRAFGANCNASSSKVTGFSICHANYHKDVMYLVTRQAIYSVALSTGATATFMFLPSWNKSMTTNPYESLCCRFPHKCEFLGSIPSHHPQYAEVPF